MYTPWCLLLQRHGQQVTYIPKVRGQQVTLYIPKVRGEIQIYFSFNEFLRIR